MLTLLTLAITIINMTAKVRISNWITKEAKKHLSSKSKEKNMSESSLLEIAIYKIK